MAATWPQPAHITKNQSLLTHPFQHSTFHLKQLSDGNLNGTALWLGGQCLAHYLAYHHSRPASNILPRAVELGSGIGLTALALASLGWDVLATDQKGIVQRVLEANIQDNITALPPGTGSIQTRELDWTVPPENWTWDNPVSVTTPSDTPAPPGLLKPPFDLIISADTVYTHELITPLLRTAHALSVASHLQSQRHPFVLFCVERRDPRLIDALFAEARTTWGFSVDRVPNTKVSKCLDKGGLKWDRADWEDVEIWKLRLK